VWALALGTSTVGLALCFVWWGCGQHFCSWRHHALLYIVYVGAPRATSRSDGTADRSTGLDDRRRSTRRCEGESSSPTAATTTEEMMMMMVYYCLSKRTPLLNNQLRAEWPGGPDLPRWRTNDAPAAPRRPGPRRPRPPAPRPPGIGFGQT
jgi:hypothetical protein